MLTLNYVEIKKVTKYGTFHPDIYIPIFNGIMLLTL